MEDKTNAKRQHTTTTIANRQQFKLTVEQKNANARSPVRARFVKYINKLTYYFQSTHFRLIKPNMHRTQCIQMCVRVQCLNLARLPDHNEPTTATYSAAPSSPPPPPLSLSLSFSLCRGLAAFVYFSHRRPALQLLVAFTTSIN